MFDLQSIPKELNNALLIEYKEIKRRFILNDWGPGNLKGGRFAEVTLRIFQHFLGDPVTPIGLEMKSKDKDNILNRTKSSPKIEGHVGQKIVPLIRLLLDFRNNRDSAHLGEFNANRMDAFFIKSTSDWIMAELFRVYGGYSMDKAEEIIREISIKEYPVIFSRDSEQFIARSNLNSKKEILVLLYTNEKGLGFDFLFLKTKDKKKDRFRKTLDAMRKDKLIEIKDDFYFIMPKGIERVENGKLLKWE